MAYKVPNVKIPVRAILLRRFMFSFQISGSGIASMKRSPRNDRNPLVKPITVKAFFTQWPPLIVLFQKKLTGVHSKVLDVQAPIVQSAV